jgi:ferritin-like metal-binding protein YciE
MPKNSEGLEQLLVEELQDLLDAEKQLVRALPKMAKTVSDEELETALRDHLEVTKAQVRRLEQVFQTLDARPRSRPCKGMRGIVEEGQEKMAEEKDQPVLDSAVTSAARKVEHYEMVGYENARSLARRIGNREAADLLEETLQEEIQADKQLATIAKRLLKQAPAMAGGEEGRKGSGRRSRSSSASGKRSSRATAGSAHPLTDHDEIRSWAEERGAEPACVRGTGGKGDIGMIRLDFPGYSGEESLEHISWDGWFEKFDERRLALLVQDTTRSGEASNFNKLVSRETAQAKTRSSRA